MGWWVACIVVWLFSAACIIVTLVRIISGKKKPFGAENFGAYIFHGSTAILALWLLLKAIR